MIIHAKGVNLIHKTIEIKNLSKLVKFIVWFNFIRIIKHISTNKFFSKNASLLQKLKNMILFCTFTLKTIALIFDEVKIALQVHGRKNILTEPKIVGYVPK